MCACPYAGMPRSPIKSRLIINGPLMCPIEALILVVEFGGPTTFARIGVMRALNRDVECVFDPSRKEHAWRGLGR